MKGYIITVVLVMIVGALLEILMPEGEFKKYIKPILGMIIVFTLLSPLMKMMSDKNQMVLFPAKQVENKYYESLYENNVIELFSHKMEDAIKTYLGNRGMQITDCQVKAKYESEKVTILQVNVETDENKEVVKTLLKNEFGIKDDAITVS